MKSPAPTTILGFLLLLCFTPPAQSQDLQSLADSVRKEFLHAWGGYTAYAWGHDALKPISREPHDWYSSSLYMTPVDAFDTMILMGLKDEARETKELVLAKLSFDLDMEVQAFEIVIRLLGGLLSAYELDGDRRFLSLAEDLGNRLLPIYETPTGMPKRYVNLRTGVTRDSINNPAEIGTALLEFGTLSKHSGNRVYYEKAKHALVQLFNHRSSLGLVGTWINVETGEWTDTRSHIRGAIDSYYEYLIKAWLLFGDEDCRNMWGESVRIVNSLLADTVDGNLWYRQVDMNTGKESGTRFGSLDAFFPAVLCLAGDTAKAAWLQQSANLMWDIAGIEPEAIDYSSMSIVSAGYYLRPEIMESAYYLYQYTREPKYVEMGKKYFRALVKFCRTDDGYAYLEDVTTKEQGDGMESFFLAETMKYLYLLLDPQEDFQFGDHVFNTEAHPFRKQ
jgi:mannosidase alpha-like ER degradation enhancer 2